MTKPIPLWAPEREARAASATPSKRPLEILCFLKRAIEDGHGAALVVLTDVVGSSSRAPGTIMGVRDDGTYMGSFSGGCTEGAVVGEARRIIAAGQRERLRFGIGSPFIDIRLPCGGGIDLLFVPLLSLVEIGRMICDLSARRETVLALTPDGARAAAVIPGQRPMWVGDVFLLPFPPALRIAIVGHGDESLALARLACTFGAEVDLLTPDHSIVEALRPLGVCGTLLSHPGQTDGLHADPETAIVFLFHDHDWEPALMERALALPAFFIGAMGSRATHARRCAALHEKGIPAPLIDRLVGPVGLIPAVRDPDTLALSVLSEIVACHRAR